MSGHEGEVALPSQFGRYTLIERLAIGGMAEVFRAKIVSSHGFEKTIVIKRILPHLAADPTFVAMFIDEAKLMARLTHPKIVQVLDFGEVAGQYFIALEFIDGRDALGLLRASAQKRIRIPLPLVVYIVAEILDALDFAHTARDMDGRPINLVHRDISPSNIFIARHGEVKLGDFGIAHADDRQSQTQAGTLKGKYGYMSPEQVTGAPLDGRSDLFAVGIVLAEAFMGRRLFTARNDLDVLLMVRDGKLERLDKYGHDVPAALDQIVRKALQRDPAQRYQSAVEFRDALSDYLYAERVRIGPTELRAFMTDLFDGSPEATARLAAQGRPLAEPRSKSEERRAAARAAAAGGAAAAVAVGPAAGASASAGQGTAAAAVEARLAQVARAAGPGAGSGPIVAPMPAGAFGDGSGASRAPGTGPEASGGSLAERLRSGTAAHRAASLGGGRGTSSGRPEGLPPGAVADPLSGPNFSGGLAVVDLDQWGHSDASSSARRSGWTPVSSTPGAPPAFSETKTDVGRFVSAAPNRPPDSAGDLGVISPMRVFADVAIAGETGLLRFERAGEAKEIFLVTGSPESVNSSVTSERFGAYLVARGVLRAAELDMALGMLPHFSGKLGDTLVGLGLMRPLDVFRLLSQQVRDRVIDVFRWSSGTFSFYRGIRNEQESFPLGLDAFEILGAGVLTVPMEDLEQRFATLVDNRPRRTERARLDPESFRLGPTPADVLGLLVGDRTLRSWMAQFTAPEELVTFLRALYLLVETDLAELD